MGTLVIAPEYKDRATVVMTEAGSTLTIGIAKAEDAGLYKCSVAVRGDQPELKHQVRIRGDSKESDVSRTRLCVCSSPHYRLLSALSGGGGAGRHGQAGLLGLRLPPTLRHLDQTGQAAA